ncbi:MAG: MetQ/NlpA family ABC transporter substrate-binding protein [Micropruina sp.]
MHPGKVDAAHAMGSTRSQTVWKVLIPEALPSLVASVTTTLVALIGYSAMAGLIGGGGLGRLAYNYGYPALPARGDDHRPRRPGAAGATRPGGRGRRRPARRPPLNPLESSTQCPTNKENDHVETQPRTLAALAAAAVAVTLTACGGSAAAPSSEAPSSASLTTVKVGASPVPHARILEFVKTDLAAAAGLDLQIVEFDDYVQPNEALASGELDANYFQHLPYLEAQIKERGYKFEHGAGVHIEPYAAFSKKYKTAAELPQGATIAITNDASNQIRGLRLLQAPGCSPASPTPRTC